MANERADLATRDDVERLVRAFYEAAFADTMIGYLFTDVAHLDLDAHIPEITDFWETILLGTHSYSGGAFAPHVALHHRSPLRGGHFDRWLQLWTTTVDALYDGPRAQLAKSHAQRVARAFHQRLQSIPSAANDPTPGFAIRLHTPDA
jgi:hemoglobin